MDPIDELLKGATCEQLLAHVQAEFSAWWDVRRRELKSAWADEEGVFRREPQFDPIAFALKYLDWAKSSEMERATKHIEIYAQVFRSSGNTEMVSSAAVDGFENRLLRSMSQGMSAAEGECKRRARMASALATLKPIPWAGEAKRHRERLKDSILVRLNPLRTLVVIVESRTAEKPDAGAGVKPLSRQPDRLKPDWEMLNGPPRFVNRKHAALLCAVTERTLDRWVASGLLKPTQRNGRKVFKTKSLGEHLATWKVDKK